MPVLIWDQELEKRIRAGRVKSPGNRYDEVWDGVLVVMPAPNNEHRLLVTLLSAPIHDIIGWEPGNHVFLGINVSDLEDDWLANYREPDVALYLAGNPAKDCDTHYMGGPDLAG